jgi:hypothetical protein
MKITFICGTLEIGRDGVGDYVRRLAITLSCMNHEVTSIALNDHYVENDVTTFYKSDSTHIVTVLRIPAKWASHKRFTRARQWIELHDPEWISLQFVPFSFHAKGLSLSLGAGLARLGMGKKWHVMFHELWVGMSKEAPTKQIMLGLLQRYLIKRLISCIRPRVSHTHTLLYKAQLTKIGSESQILRLFSNIPNISPSKTLGPAVTNNVEDQSYSTIHLVVFGNIHPRVPVDVLARDAAQYAKRKSVSVVLTMIGHCGIEQERWATIWEQAGLPFEILGEKSPEEISKTLSKASLGIATTPVYLVSKSGTAAAMLDHGLPVVCLSSPWYPMGISEEDLLLPAGIMPYEEGKLEHHLSQRIDAALVVKVSDVAFQLSSTLLASA